MGWKKVLSCTCEHEFQDKFYGKHMRLHSRCGKQQHEQPKKEKIDCRWRCSVCEREK